MLPAYGLLALLGLAAVAWVAVFAFNVAKIDSAPKLLRRDAAWFPTDGPLVSVLVPARNEEHRILEAAVRSIAAQDYPNLEVVVVDDRSTDRTRQILERIAADEPRVRVVRGEELPAGWFGKPWALEQARRHARGNWLLATDADIIFAPEAVRAALSTAFRGRFDLVTLVPSVGGGSFWARVVLPVAAWMIALVFPIEKTNDPSSPVALGCGAFLLMRREAHDAIGGYERIKREVADDVMTARLMKAAGRSIRLEDGQELVHTPMYEDLPELWAGFSKNAFAGADHRVAIVVRNAVLNVLATIAPTIAALGGFLVWTFTRDALSLSVGIFGLLAYLAMVLAFVPVYRAFGDAAWHAFLSGLANLIMVLILINSTYRHVSGRGVQWKGQRVNA